MKVQTRARAIADLEQPDRHVADAGLNRAYGLMTVADHGLSTVGQSTVGRVVQNDLPLGFHGLFQQVAYAAARQTRVSLCVAYPLWLDGWLQALPFNPDFAQTEANLEQPIDIMGVQQKELWTKHLEVRRDRF